MPSLVIKEKRRTELSDADMVEAVLINIFANEGAILVPIGIPCFKRWVYMAMRVEFNVVMFCS